MKITRLSLYVLCDNKDSRAKFENDLVMKNEEQIGAFIDQNIEPSQVCSLELKIDKHEKSYSFSHQLLCKYNGMLRLGGIKNGFEKRDCKNNVNTIEYKTATVISNWLRKNSEKLNQKTTSLI